MYKPAFIHAYKSSKTSLPINVWAKAVGRRLPQFRNEEDVYSPIPIHVKLAGSLNDSNGAVRLSIMPTNRQWYSELTNALAEMTGERAVEVVNYLGEPIANMSPEQLMAVGECDCVRRGSDEPIRLGAVVPPPLHLSTNKQAELKEWWNQMRSPLAEKIALQLKGMTMAEIAKATLVDGPVQDTIHDYLTQHTLHDLPWDKFLSTYGVAGNTDVEAMSRKLLDAVRQSLVANETQIRTHHASIGTEAALWKKTSTHASQYQDDFTLYRDIVEDAMYHPLVGQQMVHAILHGTVSIAGRHGKRKSKSKKKKSERKHMMGDAVHPINSYYQTFHFNEHGKLPGHRIAELNRGGIASEYPGDVKRAMDAFNLFSGRAVEMTKTNTRLMPLGEAVAHVERIRGQMPELIPIAHVDHEMPELIPIDCPACEKKKKGKKKSASVRSQMPELIPIRNELPRLIPLEVPTAEELAEPIWVDDCPNLMDFLKK